MSEVELLDLKTEDLNLQLQEIKVKRELIRIQREKIENKNLSIVDTPVPNEDSTHKLHLHYSDSAMSKVPDIYDICEDGTIFLYGKNRSRVQTHKYTMRSLSWLKRKLPHFSKRQKHESGFWGAIAEQYSKQFTSISRTTIEQLCFFVDSGACDVWFDKWVYLKNKDVQGTLDGGRL